MPNWVSINMTVSSKTPKEMSDFREKVSMSRGDDVCALSFQRIIPMPEILKKSERDSFSTIGYSAFYGDPSAIMQYPWVQEAGVKTVEDLRRFLESKDVRYKQGADLARQAIEETGCSDWYEWSIENWGTKWDSCHVEVCKEEDCFLELTFSTAWSFPVPVFNQLAKQFPNLQFQGSFIEEGDFFEGDFESEFDSENMEINVYDVDRDEEFEDDDDDDDDISDSDSSPADEPNDSADKSRDLGSVKPNNWF